MGLCLGNKLVTVGLNGKIYYCNIFSTTPAINGMMLSTSEGYRLKDFNDLYLISNNHSQNVVDNLMLSFDKYILKEINGLYLTTNKEEL